MSAESRGTEIDVPAGSLEADPGASVVMNTTSLVSKEPGPLHHPVCKQGIAVEGGSCATIQSTAIVGYPTGSEDTSATARGIYITGGSSAVVMSCCILPNVAA